MTLREQDVRLRRRRLQPTDCVLQYVICCGWIKLLLVLGGNEEAVVCSCLSSLGSGSVSVWIIKLGNYRLGCTEALYTGSNLSSLFFFAGFTQHTQHTYTHTPGNSNILLMTHLLLRRGHRAVYTLASSRTCRDMLFLSLCFEKVTFY